MGMSVIERMAMSIATTMKPTTSPIARMIPGDCVKAKPSFR